MCGGQGEGVGLDSYLSHGLLGWISFRILLHIDFNKFCTDIVLFAYTYVDAILYFWLLNRAGELKRAITQPIFFSDYTLFRS